MDERSPRSDLRFFWKRPEKIDGVSLSREERRRGTVMAELFQEAESSHLFRKVEGAISPSTSLGYSPALHARLSPVLSPPPLFLSVISIKRHMQLRVVANSITTSPLVREARGIFFPFLIKIADLSGLRRARSTSQKLNEAVHRESVRVEIIIRVTIRNW